ncbi:MULTISPECIES: substrate-binding domain-containing protein [unclassified Devosia]|uniref:substrate-binding domain-containing protein n=1 Tax=unclassified Devosia TaxID=196773 RepID=UPI0015520C06|nr:MULTISPECIES: substrate-binding domain-containing protein [unclassified Devosia]
MNTKLWLLLAGSALVMACNPVMAQDKKELAIVVKGLDNPYFEEMHQGCELWNEENPDSEYICTYTGPALSSDEAGEVQIVDDLLTRGVAAMAISPSNAPAMANLLKQRAPTIPIMTIDADLLEADADLRKGFIGHSNYLLGEEIAKELMALKPEGGTVCFQLGNVAAANINERVAGARDTLAGAENTDRLTGQGGWTEVEGCPVYTNDDSALANTQLTDVLTANPDIDALFLVGGWAQFSPQAYTQVTDPIMDKLQSKEIVIVSSDLLDTQVQAFKQGRSHANVAQQPFEMGHQAPDLMIKLIEGEPVEEFTYLEFNKCTQADPGACQ